MPNLTARVSDAQDNVLGMAWRIGDLSITQRLDEIGSFSMTVPIGADTDVSMIERGLYIVIEDDFKEIFRGVIDDKQRMNDSYVVTGSDLLTELQYPETGAYHAVNSVPLNNLIQQQITLAPNWSASINASTLPSVAVFRGKELWGVLKELAQQQGYHLRRGAGRMLEMGAFGEDSGDVLVNVGRTAQGIAVLPIDRFEENSAVERLVNRIVALGGGYTDDIGAQQTLTLGGNRYFPDYVVQSRSRGGRTELYIEDGDSISKYGAREAVMVFNDITPSDFTLRAAAQDALKSRAGHYLQRHRYPQKNYTLTTPITPTAKVGDKVKVIYQTDDTQVNSLLFLTALTTRYSGTTVSYDLRLSTIDEQALDNASLLFEVLTKLRNIQNRDISL